MILCTDVTLCADATYAYVEPSQKCKSEQKNKKKCSLSHGNTIKRWTTIKNKAEKWWILF